MSPVQDRAGHVIVTLVAFATLAAGCGGDGGEAADPITPITPTTPTTSAAEEAVETVTVDYAFQGLPERLDAGTRLSLRNDSSAEVHELVAFRLPEGEERPVAELMQLPEEELGAFLAGQPALVLVAPPGEEGFVVLGDGTLSQPGRYLILCTIPTGADAEEFVRQSKATPVPPQVEGGPPHFTHGMFGELTVE